MIEFYLGRRSIEEVLSAAVRPRERCEAQFHIGQHHLLRGNRAEAETALKAAAGACSKTSAEYAVAVVELNRLGARQ